MRRAKWVKEHPDARRAYEAGYRKGWAEAMLATGEHLEGVLADLPPEVKVITDHGAHYAEVMSAPMRLSAEDEETITRLLG